MRTVINVRGSRSEILAVLDAPNMMNSWYAWGALREVVRERDSKGSYHLIMRRQRRWWFGKWVERVTLGNDTLWCNVYSSRHFNEPR